MPKKPVKYTETLRYDFTDSEVLSMARMQSEHLEALETLEEQKKQVAEDFKARITGVEVQVSMLRPRMVSRYEMRPVEVEIRFDDPEVGVKSSYRMDCGELLRTVPMEDHERQEELPLEAAN